MILQIVYRFTARRSARTDHRADPNDLRAVRETGPALSVLLSSGLDMGENLDYFEWGLGHAGA